MTTRTPLPPVPPLPQNAVQPLTPPQRTTPPTLQAPIAPSGYSQAPQASGYGPPPQSQHAGYAAPSGYGPPPTAYAPPAPPAPTGYGPPPASYAPATQMSGYGAPPAPTGYGAPPAPTGYGAPPAPTGYGAPPAQAGYGSLPPLGWQASSPSYGAPPHPGAKQGGVPKAAIIGGGIAAAFVVFGAIGIGAWAILRTSHKPLPVAAAKLPSDTDFFHEDRFPGADGPPAVRDAFLASDLARHVCGAGSDFADRVMRLRTSPSDAVTLFDPKTIEARKATLACGQQLLGALETPAFTELVFHDGDDKKFLGVEMLRLNVTELPAKFGFAKQTFSGFAGQCLVSPKKTEPDFKWTSNTTLKVADEKEKDGECNDTSLAAFHDGPTWFFGQRRAIEAFARSYAKPREELSTTVENLQLAFDSGEGLAVRRADARPKAASSLLKLPCSHAAFDSGAGSKFIEECLPKSVEKNASSIDAKVRAVTYELAAPIQDSDGIRFNMFFVARDNDAAKDVENELKDAARDWKSSIENDEANLAKMVREAPSQLGQRKWSVAIETFVRAIKHGTVSRNGRVVAFKLSEKFSSNEQKEMREVMSKSTEDQQALATITQALVKNQPVPEATLAQITGPEWASIALAPRLTDKECAPLREKLNRFDMTNPAAVPHALRFAIRIKCEGQPMPAASLACLNTAKDAQAFGKCPLPTNPLDPTKLGATNTLGALDGAKPKSILQ